MLGTPFLRKQDDIASFCNIDGTWHSAQIHIIWVVVLKLLLLSIGQACTAEGTSTPQLVSGGGGSGLQRWVISQVPGNADQYYIISRGLAGQCRTFLGVTACSSSAGLGTFSGDDGGLSSIHLDVCVCI